jgi:hypothetical protein
MEKDTVPLSLPSGIFISPITGGSAGALSPDAAGVLPLGALAKVSVFARHPARHPAMSRTKAAKKSGTPALSADKSRKFRS